MSVAARPQGTITPDEYLEGERHTEFRHEYVDGRVYVLVEQNRLAMTVLRRAADGWRTEELEGAAAVLKLPEIGCEVPLERIYERTTARR